MKQFILIYLILILGSLAWNAAALGAVKPKKIIKIDFGKDIIKKDLEKRLKKIEMKPIILEVKDKKVVRVYSN